MTCSMVTRAPYRRAMHATYGATPQFCCEKSIGKRMCLKLGIVVLLSPGTSSASLVPRRLGMCLLAFYLEPALQGYLEFMHLASRRFCHVVRPLQTNPFGEWSSKLPRSQRVASAKL